MLKLPKADYPAELAGAIALIGRGTCTFGIKAALSKAAGAIGTIIYNNVPNTVLQGTLGEPGNYAPTVGITQEDGQAFAAAIAAGTVQNVELTVDLDEVTT
jgi:carboxypeptidase Q